jgi:hypothetical protein
MPNQAVEAIVKQIKAEGKEKLLILAPDTPTGYMLSNNALESAKIYGIEISGLYFFEEGDTNGMKELADKAALYESRAANLVHAKEILSDVLITQKLTPAEKESVRLQLDDLNKKDSLGEVNYDAVLFLGNAADSKTMGSYLRYYDVAAANVNFYGSALWDAETVYKDGALAGGEYAALPRISDDFAKLYSDIEGVLPNRFDTIGYDAAMLGILSLGGGKPAGAYLLDPSGYRGLDGLVRLRPNGENERALEIMQLNGVRLPMAKGRSADNFAKPIYLTSKYSLDKPSQKKLSSAGYSPMDYIKLPERIAGEYESKTFGATDSAGAAAEEVIIMPEDGEVVTNKDFTPSKPKSVDRKLIDEVKMKAN